MANPFTFASGTPAASTAPQVNVTTATAAGDALTVAVLVTGASVSSVTDSKGNSYVQKSNPAASNIWVFAAQGNTAALVAGATPDKVTVNLTASATAEIICTDLPGVNVIDVNTSASGTSTSASVSGTPGFSGESALAVFGWGAAGGAGSMQAPFTQLTQLSSGGPILTTGYDVNPASGVLLTASDTIVSAAWTAILITFEAAVTPSGTVQPRATVPVPRRRIARALVAFRPVATTNAPPPPPPNGTVQPRATVPVPRRRLSRAVVAFRPVATANRAAPRTLLLSLAATAGTDDFGNAYPQGIAAFEQISGVTYALQLGRQTFGSVTAPAFFILNQQSAPFLPPAYTATGVSAAGCGAEIVSGQGTSGAALAAVTVQDSLQSGVPGGLIDLIAGAVAFNGAQMPVPSGYPLASGATTAQIVTTVNSLIAGMIAAGLIA